MDHRERDPGTGIVMRMLTERPGITFHGLFYGRKYGIYDKYIKKVKLILLSETDKIVLLVLLDAIKLNEDTVHHEEYI